MSTVGNSRVDQATQYQAPTGSVSDSGQVKGGAGPGVSGQVFKVPDKVLQAQVVLEALRTMAPDSALLRDFETLLAKVTAKLKESLGTVEQSRVDSEMQAKRVNIKENEAKIEESKKKLDESEAKRKSGDIGQLLQLLFEAIAGAIMAIVGAVGMVLGGGTAALGLLTSGGSMLISSLNSAVAMATGGTGILGTLAKLLGLPDEVAMAMDMYFVAALMTATLAMGYLTGTGMIGAAAIGAVDTLGDTTKLAMTVLKVATAIGSAGSQVATGAVRMDAAVDSAEAKVKQAQSDELQALLKQLDDLIDMAMAMLMQVKGNVNGVMDSYSEMLTDASNTLSNTRF